MYLVFCFQKEYFVLCSCVNYKLSSWSKDLILEAPEGY